MLASQSLPAILRRLTSLGSRLPEHRVEPRVAIDKHGCSQCGGDRFTSRRVVPAPLAETWGLGDRELAWLEDREGHFCDGCGLSRRVRMLHWTLRSLYPSLADLDVLHINQVNGLVDYLRTARSTVETLFRPELAAVPDVEPVHADVENLPFDDGRFDLVVHSETLEHVFDPRRAMREIHRVLRRGGRQVYTVPLVPGRPTRRRMRRRSSGEVVHLLEPSFHGLEGEYPVVWELGDDYFGRRGRSIERLVYDDREANPLVFAVVERA